MDNVDDKLLLENVCQMAHVQFSCVMGEIFNMLKCVLNRTACVGKIETQHGRWFLMPQSVTDRNTIRPGGKNPERRK